MNIEGLIHTYIKGAVVEDPNALELCRELLSYRAEEKDVEIKNELLTNLVFKYSDAEKKLIELNQLKNKFLGIASHDLRNPLSSIRGFSELLLSEAMGPLVAEQKNFLGIIHTVSSDMLTLLNDLLDVSAIESGKLDLEIKTGPLGVFIEQRIGLNSIIAKKKGIRLHQELSETPDLPFDPIRIGQVIDNLLSNAVKFSPSGSNIYISLSHEGPHAEVKVKDEGPGLSPEDHGKLFGEFQKLSARPTGGEISTGLGLSIVKKIIEAHKGTIRAESVPGNGTSFIFTLPLRS